MNLPCHKTRPGSAIFMMALVSAIAPLIASGQTPESSFRGDPQKWSEAKPYYNRANHYLERGRCEDAIQDYHRAIALYAFDPDFYINLGIAYRKIDDLTSAEQCFQQAIKLNDKDWVPWSNLANIYLKEDRLNDSITTYRMALKCDLPDSERRAILKDMADMSKFLKVPGGKGSKAPPKGDASGKRPASEPSLAGKANTGITPSARPKPAAKREGLQPPVMPSLHQDDLKRSGWDWVYSP